MLQSQRERLVGVVPPAEPVSIAYSILDCPVRSLVLSRLTVNYLGDYAMAQLADSLPLSVSLFSLSDEFHR